MSLKHTAAPNLYAICSVVTDGCFGIGATEAEAWNDATHENDGKRPSRRSYECRRAPEGHYWTMRNFSGQERVVAEELPGEKPKTNRPLPWAGPQHYIGDGEWEYIKERVNACAGIEDLTGKIAFVIALLSKLQWSDCDYCPECGNDEREGHAEECNLASALRALGDQP